MQFQINRIHRDIMHFRKREEVQERAINLSRTLNCIGSQLDRYAILAYYARSRAESSEVYAHVGVQDRYDYRAIPRREKRRGRDRDTEGISNKVD